MQEINCFKIHGRQDLQDRFENALKEGRSEKQAAREVILEEHEKLHNKSEELKSLIYGEDKYIKKEFVPHDNSEKIKSINEKYAAKESIQPIESISEKTESAATPTADKIIEPTKEGTGTGKGEEMRLTHADTEQIYKEAGLPERLDTPIKHREQLEKEAEEKLKKGYDFDKVADQVMEGKYKFEDADQLLFARKVADLKVKQEGLDIKSPEFEKAQNQIEKLSRASDVAGTEIGRALQSRKNYVPVDETISDYVTQEKQSAGVETLTDNQKETVKKEYEDISEAKKKFDEYMAQKESDFAAKMAKAAFEKQKSTTPKTKKTHEDHVEYRKKVIEDIREKLKKSRGDTQATIVPYAKELIAIAPDVAKLMKDLVEEGVSKLEDVVSNIHGQLKDVIPQIQEKDVHDIIAGVYNEKKQTKSDMLQKITDLRTEAMLVNKLYDLEKSTEPKEEKKKIERNQKITSLRAKIKPYSDLQAQKTKMTNEIKELEYKLKTGDFDKESAPQKPPLKLDAEGLIMKDKLVKLKQDRQIRLLKQEYANRSPYQKATDKALEVLNVPRTLMSSMDYSAPLRQGLIASISHPRTAGLAGIEMFRQSVSQKRFDRWFYDLKESKNYKLMQESELYVSDPHDPKLSAKEEAFMNNLAEKIPLVGRLIKGSERAYVGYLNKLRVDLFNRFAERFMSFGKTIENSPELYKQMADYVNNSTGRGKLGFAENAAPMLNSFLFSPRLIASRINLLTKPFTPSFYTKTPKEIRVMYAKDMLKFIGLGMTVLAIAKLNGAEVEDDPRSTDFGKIKSGNTRWDIWGGFQPYIRVFSQMATGEKKNVTDKQIKELNGEKAFGETRGDVLTRFARGKLAPVPSMVWDFLSNRTVTGDKPTIGSEAESHLLPLLYSDVKSAMQDKGVSSLFTVGVPSAFGVGVQTFEAKPAATKKQRTHKQTRQ